GDRLIHLRTSRSQKVGCESSAPGCKIQPHALYLDSCENPGLCATRLRAVLRGMWRMGNNGTEKIPNNNSAGSSETTIEIKIKTLDSQTYTLRVDKQMPVPALKEQIASVTGVLSERQRLICQGKVLKDDQLLSAYHVEDGHTLHLVVRQPDLPPPGSVPNHSVTEPNSSTSHGHSSQVAPGVFIETFNVPVQGDGVHPEINRIVSAVLGSIGLPNFASGGEGIDVRGLREILRKIIWLKILQPRLKPMLGHHEDQVVLIQAPQIQNVKRWSDIEDNVEFVVVEDCDHEKQNSGAAIQPSLLQLSPTTPFTMAEQTEKAFLKQPKVFLSSKKSAKGNRPGKGGNRFFKSIGLGFKTPREAIEGTYIDKKCPFTGSVSIRGRILAGTCHSAKMNRTIIVRRNYLHFIKKYQRYEKRHSNIPAHMSPCFRVKEGDHATLKDSEIQCVESDPSWIVYRCKEGIHWNLIFDFQC
ncbi:40S ribosomal protein S11, partial [Mucuna pruriens]